jgi:uncharacterized protein (TIGR02271 family)
MASKVAHEVALGYFEKKKQAEAAVRALREAGFAQIGIAGADEQQAGNLAEKTGVRSGVAASTDPGGELKDVLGEPEYATLKDLHQSLSAAGLSPKQARNYEQRLRSGGFLVTVQAPVARAMEAREIMNRAGAGEPEPIEEMPAEPAEPAAPVPATSGLTAPLARPAAFPEPAAGEGQTIALHGELLRVHKERVQRGEVRVRKEVVTEPQTVEVPVSREELVVERRDVPEGTPLPAANAENAFRQSGEIRVPLTEEQVRVEKQPRVREEVAIGKREVPGTKRVEENVRSERLSVEEEGRLTPEERAELERQRRAA